MRLCCFSHSHVERLQTGQILTVLSMNSVAAPLRERAQRMLDTYNAFCASWAASEKPESNGDLDQHCQQLLQLLTDVAANHSADLELPQVCLQLLCSTGVLLMLISDR